MTSMVPSQHFHRINRLNEKGLLTFTGQSHITSYRFPKPKTIMANNLFVTREHLLAEKGIVFAGVALFRGLAEGKIVTVETSTEVPHECFDMVLLWNCNQSIRSSMKGLLNNGSKISVTCKKFGYNEINCSKDFLFKFVEKTPELRRIITLATLNQ